MSENLLERTVVFAFWCISHVGETDEAPEYIPAKLLLIFDDFLNIQRSWLFG